ncbi:MAG: GIY-YIG nuclease family protein [Alphaproteobacteria bacterium]|nr:GIY-YIG nuclease family protein [Alphaproteobacteria bacterium]
MEINFSCKIGRSNVKSIDHITNQARTSYPEFPHYALLIHCENAINMENALHSVLKLRGRWTKKAPSKEWFRTNAEEVGVI